jgi:hypothetical protein
MQMTDQEQLLFLEITSVRGISEMAEGFGRLPAAQQQNFLDHTLWELEQLQSGSSEAFQKILAQDKMDRIVREGLAQYLREADALSRIELQPVVERLQNVLQRTR